MRNYFIKVFSSEEKEAVMNLLKTEFEVERLESSGSSVLRYATISFKASKEEWRKIKSRLNLEVESVFARRKIVI